MILILKDENIDVKRIKFKKIRYVIKITYDIDYLLLIGLTITINDYDINYNIKDNFKIIKFKNKNQIEKLKQIDNYINDKIGNYRKFLNNDNSILINNIKTLNVNKPINITINNLKKEYDYYKVQIFISQ